MTTIPKGQPIGFVKDNPATWRKADKDALKSASGILTGKDAFVVERGKGYEAIQPGSFGGRECFDSHVLSPLVFEYFCAQGVIEPHPSYPKRWRPRVFA